MPIGWLSSAPYLPASRHGRIHIKMKDNSNRIVVVALDIGIIVLMLVSLIWNAPAFKTQEDPQPMLTKTFDDRWAD